MIKEQARPPNLEHLAETDPRVFAIIQRVLTPPEEKKELAWLARKICPLEGKNYL